jgi:hypothetical protein
MEFGNSIYDNEEFLKLFAPIYLIQSGIIIFPTKDLSTSPIQF